MALAADTEKNHLEVIEKELSEINLETQHIEGKNHDNVKKNRRKHISNG